MSAMSTDESDRQRLARLMDERRAVLDKTWAEVADDAGLTREGLRRLREGRGRTIRSLSKAGIERALEWEHGSVNTILGGGDPIPARPAQAEHDETLAEIRRTLAALRQDLRDHLGDRNQTVGDALIDGLEALVEESTSETPKP